MVPHRHSRPLECAFGLCYERQCQGVLNACHCYGSQRLLWCVLGFQGTCDHQNISGPGHRQEVAFNNSFRLP